MREQVGENQMREQSVPVEYSGVKTVMLSETEGPKEEKPRKQLRKQECRKKQERFFM